MEWQAPRRNFYSLTLCILNRNYTPGKALNYFGITHLNEVKTPVKKTENPHFDKPIPTKEELQELYKTMNQYELAKHYNISQGLVSRWMKHYNIKVNKVNYLIAIDKAKLEEMIDKKVSILKIAKAFNVSITPIYRAIEEYGLMEKYKSKKENIA